MFKKKLVGAFKKSMHNVTKSFLFALLVISSCSDFKRTKVLYFAHSLPVNHPVHKGIEKMKESLERQSKGELKIKIFPDGQLGTEREVLELLQFGSVTMTKVSAASMSNFAPEYQVVGIPYLFRDREHLFTVLESDIGRDLLESGSEFKLRGLCFYDAGARNFYSKKKPIITPDDLNGMKIRTMNNQLSVDLVNVLGGSATPMAYGELYNALQQNIVDGAENNIPSFVTSNHYEVCKYYSFNEHTMVPDVVVIGVKFWNQLNEQQRKWLQIAANQSVVEQKKSWNETVLKNMEMLSKANVEFFYPDKTEFSDKTDQLFSKLKEDAKMKGLIEKIQSMK
ncbi:MAG: TRAP transporter substrate-binding protein [Flavobacteriaceae bacterium]|nr:TRAP transporter substrate-binding protein [Flavobacteriaceae bacterium]